MNEYDSNRIYDLTSTIGFNKTDIRKEADCFILNTCHIREKATEKVYDDMKAKLKAAGKFWYGDYVENVNVFMETKDGIERLLKDHGRESEMGW